MFSEVSVSHSVHRGSASGRGKVCPRRGLPLWGVCLRGREVASRGSAQSPKYCHLAMATAVLGTHPTGMHSCLSMFLFQLYLLLDVTNQARHIKPLPNIRTYS